ncbi:LepB GTPase-activating domain-containing protein [Legionella drancourtii]|uniref:Effector protein B, substrate of the Dot/Icm secretion system n=1 Tax=Legionella drancourtii LLAP12 TaxID=658187 RepID=G9EPL4_9GAMM|nr:LepB GTPase-activating domain-containing protein [Legionella drancourtii]EHL30787.1 hypothetical protein LDG_7216 [Legionella drancourtii LLAP12]
MTITYNGKELTRFKAKSSGKNQSEIDGFYRDALDCERYFIKKPADQCELFAEAFAGAILQEIMDRGLIDKIYHPSLIVASVVRVDDGTGKPEYALIQPMVSFVALHETIETSYTDGSDRDPLKEAYAGSDYYLRLLEQQQFGLTSALMFSIWLSAHSVHSGNIVTLNNDKMISKQRARLDWGDAFRFLAHPKNNENILYAYENRGVLNYKSWTKDYFLNYKKIPGLFSAMAEKGRLFKAALQENELLDILRSALQKLPADLIEQQTKDRFAQKDIYMDSFRTVQLGPESDGGTFIPEMAKILNHRLDKITELQDLTLQSAMGDMYQSIFVATPPLLQMEQEQPFPELIRTWAGLLGQIGVESVRTEEVNFGQLAKCFNDYLNTVAEHCEQQNIWQHKREENHNFFTAFKPDASKAALHGHAYIAHYKESVILRHLSIVDPKTLGMLRFAPYEAPSTDYCRHFPDSPWAKMQRLATAGQNIILQLRLIQNGQMLEDDFMKEKLPVLQKALDDFMQYKTEVDALLAHDSEVTPVSTHDSSFFYDIDEQTLNAMSGDQLATICFEELNAPHPSRLIMRILKSDSLWQEVDDSLNGDAFMGRQDDICEKRNKICQWRQLVQMTTAMQLENEAQVRDGFAQQLKERDHKLEQAKVQQSEIELKINTLTQHIGKLTQQIKEDTEQHQHVLEQQKEVRLSLNEQLKTSENERLKAEITVAQLQVELSDLGKRLQLQTKSTQEEQLKTAQQVDALNQQIDKLTTQIKENAAQAQMALEQSAEANRDLKAQLDTAELKQLEAKEAIGVLENQLREFDAAHLKGKEHASALEQQIVALKRLVEENLEQYQHALAQLDDEKSGLEQKLNLSEKERSQAQSTSEQLTQQIHLLTRQAAEQKQMLGRASASLDLLTEQVAQKEVEIQRLKKEFAEQTQHSKDMANASLDLLTVQVTQKEEEIQRLRKEFAEQTQHSKDTASASLDLLTAQVTQKEEEIQHLKKELAEQAAYMKQSAKLNDSGLEPDAVQQLIVEQIAAQKKYEDALKKEKKNIQFARTLQMAPVVKRIEALQDKARELDKRNEAPAFNAVTTLVANMYKAVHAYIDSDKSDDDALTDFKTEAPRLIQAADKDLGEHRKKWKYVLANLSLAILTVGIGYLAAMVVNKVMNKRFTFFNETDSHAKLKELELDITNTKLGPAASA